MQSIFSAALAKVNPADIIKNTVKIDYATSSCNSSMNCSPVNNAMQPAQKGLVIKTGLEEYFYSFSDYDRIFAIGMGKASARMAMGLESVLEHRLTGGIIAVKEGFREKLEYLEIIEAGHPVPDWRSVKAAEALLKLEERFATKLTDRDLVIVLVSGGGSAILCSPAPGITLADKSMLTKQLLASGASIAEINCVRKHLSGIKGGRLAYALYPASVLGLVLSDVVGDELEAIASGPTVPDSTTYSDAIDIIKRYGLHDSLSKALIEHLNKGLNGIIEDSPKPDNVIFKRAKTLVVGSNHIALLAAEEEAVKLGYNSLILTSRLEGEAKEAAKFFLGIAKDIAESDFPVKKPACLICGGETTVSIKGSGKGGRNQEMALAFLSALGRNPKNGEGLTFLSAGTDGNDGPTDAAGAIVNLELYNKAVKQQLSPEKFLSNNDSYSFFEKAGGFLKTGPTNTNVCDIQLLIVE